MIFVRRPRHEPHQVRTRVLFPEEVRLQVGRGIVAAVVDVPVGAFGGDDLHALRQVRSVVHLVELILKPLVDEDLRHRHANPRELADGFRHDLVRRDAERMAATVHLDADDVRGLEETAPCVGRHAGAGQGAHAPRHHLAHGLVAGPARDGVHGLIRLHRYDAAWIGTRHSGSRRRGVVGDDTECWSSREVLERFRRRARAARAARGQHRRLVTRPRSAITG